MILGTASTGTQVDKITLQAGDLHVNILTWGAAIQDVRLAGVDHSLTLGADSIADYEGDMCHHGTLIGPIVNRISTGRIKIAGMMYELERNQGDVHLHSGADATHRRNWTIADRSDSHVTLTCTLVDGECGLPGNREITVTYRVTAPATLSMDIKGTTDTKTAFNLANHSYWNLDGTDTWDGHSLQINADRFLPSTPDDYPTGEIVDVADTAMDFRNPCVINTATHPFDNNFCLSDSNQPLRDVLTLIGTSGVKMTMATTAPGIQVYDGKGAMRPGRDTYEGLAFEAQHWPDAPNNPDFPSILVEVDDTYHQQTTWAFKT